MSFMSKGIAVVMAVIIVGAFLAVGGILQQSLRDSQTSTSKAYDIADAGLNSSTSLGAQLPTVGRIGGVFILVAIAVGLLLLLAPLAKKFSGGGNKGGKTKVYYVR